VNIRALFVVLNAAQGKRKPKNPHHQHHHKRHQGAFFHFRLSPHTLRNIQITRFPKFIVGAHAVIESFVSYCLGTLCPGLAQNSVTSLIKHDCSLYKRSTPENSGMKKIIKRAGLAVGLSLGLGLLVAEALAHGDVTPHAVDTSSLQPVGKEWVAANPYRGNEKAVAVGADGYLHNCAGCHGLNANSGGVAPDLLLLTKDCLGMTSKDQQASCLKDTDEYFKEITLNGKKTSDGRYVMPAYSSVFTQEAVWAVKTYTDARTVEENAKKAK
jgi:cytochrome c-550 PedF